MPASRRARAITFAPRSWPSKPGLATSTRIRSIQSDVSTAAIGKSETGSFQDQVIVLLGVNYVLDGVRGTFCYKREMEDQVAFCGSSLNDATHRKLRLTCELASARPSRSMSSQSWAVISV